MSGQAKTDYATVTNLTTTGINILSTIASTGQAAWIASQNNALNISGNLATTGVTLGGKIDSLSGWAANITNLALTGSTLDSKINSLSGATTTASNLTSTGQTLYQDITGMSGQSNTNYATVTNLQSTGSSLYINLTGFSGQSNTNFATVANVTTTGVALGNKIASLSGWSASAVNLTSSGSTLDSKINALSGSTIVASSLTTTGQTLYNLVVGMSGQSDTNYASVSNLVTTGTKLSAVQVTGSATINAVNLTGLGGTLIIYSGSYVLISGAAGGGGVTQSYVDTAIANTGQAAWIAAQNNATNVSGNLTTTGQTLQNLAIGGDTNLSGNMTTTGVTLGSKIDSLSGWAASAANLITTGATVRNTAISIGATISGNLTTTGQTLQNFSIGGDTNLSGNLTTTGVNLGSKIDSLSGWATSSSFAVGIGTNLSGNLTTTGQTLQTLAVGIGTIISGNLTTSGVNLGAKIDSLSGWATSTTFAVGIGTNLSGNLTATGQTLLGNILAISGVGSNISGNMAITGQTLQNLAVGIGTIISGNLTTTGVNLGAKIDSLSGWATNSAFVVGVGTILSGNLTTTGQTLQGLLVGGDTNLSGNLTTTGVNLGAKIDLLSGWATSSSFAVGIGVNLSGNLTTTGVNLGAKIDSLSGWSSNMTNLASTGSTLDSKINSLSGVIVVASSLTTTGQTLYNLITGSSGQANTNYATATNLTTSGANIYSWISTISGGTYSTGNVGSTGSYLYNAIIGLSGTSVILQSSGIALPSGSSVYFGPMNVSYTGIANRPLAAFYDTGWGPTFVGPALWNKQVTAILPAATTSQTILGDTAANVGTLSTATTEVLGDYTLYTPAAGLQGGTSSTTAHVYRGSTIGRNGFFFVSKFALLSNWASGLAIGTYGNPSGSRIFVGLSDQALAASVNANEPAGNRIGLQFLWASGGSVGTGQYMQNWAITSRNNVATTTGTTSMNFQTGFYRFAMYCKPWPDNNTIWWQLDDLIRGSGCSSIVTATLPIGSTAMRPIAALGVFSGIKTISTSVVYVETPGTPLD
jgi:hypothetical protein